LWNNVQVTAVEFDAEIAGIYKEFFPDDNVIVGDAHDYLLNNYKNFDFIWASPPCQSHSGNNKFLNAQGIIRYPDMKLWQEIIFLKQFSKAKWVVENVIPYYEPFVKPTVELDRHFFWSNFRISKFEIERLHGNINDITRGGTHYGINLRKYKIKQRKDVILRNMVNPEIGLYIMEQVMGIIRSQKHSQPSLFDER
jgi:DNA (cytosine-5)-methyltransferase 1